MCARERIQSDGPFAPPASLLLLMFLGLIIAPVSFYLYLAHPDWTWMYILNPEVVPGFALVPLVVSHSLVIAGGWYLGAKLIIANRMKIAVYLTAGGTGLSLLGCIIFKGRLGRYGTYLEFQQGRALDIMEVKLGYVMVAVVIGTVSSCCFLAYELIRDSRRVRSK